MKTTSNREAGKSEEAGKSTGFITAGMVMCAATLVRSLLSSQYSQELKEPSTPQQIEFLDEEERAPLVIPWSRLDVPDRSRS
ncbi:MAG: hypothetical protein H8E66_05705 [Planctomycetes bacterium]|nr:hypothetical protein [Planctomycetota bacterium]